MFFSVLCTVSTKLLILQVDAYMADPETATTNRLIAQSYKDGVASGVYIQPTTLPHYVSGRKDMVLYKNRPQGEWGGERDGTEKRPNTKL